MTMPTDMNDNQKLREILEHLVSHFAEKDDDGNWWGFDTNLGSRTQDFAAAIRSIKGQNLYHRRKKLKLKSYNQLKLNRQAIATAVWGDKIPRWWRGSTGEWEVLALIAQVNGTVEEL